MSSLREYHVLPNSLMSGPGKSLIGGGHIVGLAKRTAASLVVGDFELWTPAEIAKELWLDTSNSTAIIESGKVSQRNDLSGNNRHATQSTSGLRPTAGTNKDIYDGTDDRMVVADDAAMNSPAYICCVCKPTVTGQYSGLLDKWAGGGSVGWMIGTSGQRRHLAGHGCSSMAKHYRLRQRAYLAQTVSSRRKSAGRHRLSGLLRELRRARCPLRQRQRKRFTSTEMRFYAGNCA